MPLLPLSLRKLIFLLIYMICMVAIPCKLISSQSPVVSQQTKEQNRQLCLTMIVKNESAIIERCLNSVKDIVDCLSICDTGSTDNTKEIIEQFMLKNHIPGKVHDHQWENFGINRSLSIEAAKQTLAELNITPQNTYLLLLDADMMLVAEPDFSKKSLMHDMYLLKQKNSNLVYYNTRLVRASLPWKCVGVTHEYWASPVPTSSTQLQSLWIDDRNDGGCKSDKYERDIRLLTQGVKDEPNNTRYFFYLAQSYNCVGQHQEAIKWYKERINKGGWMEEVWYSQFMLGEIYEAMGQWGKALRWYLEAFEYNSARSEPLQKISTHYRIKGENDLAYFFAKKGSKIPFPKNQVLFISHPVYDYLFDQEISIAANYTPYLEDGFIALNRLILSPSAPNDIKEVARRNVMHYVKKIKLEQEIPTEIAKKFDNQKKSLVGGLAESLSISTSGPDFSLFSPSTPPIEFNDGYLQVVREEVLNSDLQCFHRFVWMDKNFKIIQLTLPFTFIHTGIEYCKEIAVDQSGKMYILTIDYGDDKAFNVSVNKKTIEGLLIDLPIYP